MLSEGSQLTWALDGEHSYIDMPDEKKASADPFVRQRVFPDAAQVFGFAPAALGSLVGDAVVAVDTNALLVPYNTGPASIAQIRRTYKRLAADGRLRIPGQVAREFAVHRAEKIKTLYQQIFRKRNVQIARSQYPLLEGLPAYAAVQRHEDELAQAVIEYQKSLGRLLDVVGSWNWDDPVSTLYREILTAGVVVDPPFDENETLKGLKYRQDHAIPPGYKDAGNQFSGIGDHLIWQTILQIGRDTQQHMIFVSGDEKTDWRYQSENQALYVRYELVDEYRRASGGKSLHIISFAELLKRFGAPEAVVAEVHEEETAAFVQQELDRLPISSRDDGAITPPNDASSTAAFMRPLQPDAQLAAIVGADPMPRTQVVARVWEYIKKNGLQENRNIRADEKLRPIFGKDQITMFEMMKLINAHLSDAGI